MRRREFNLSLLSASAAVILRRSSSAAAAHVDDQPSAHMLFSKSVVIDSLCAPLPDAQGSSTPSPADLEAVRQSGITAVNCSISLPDFDETLSSLANVQQLAETYSDYFLIVRRHSDIAWCKRENRLGIVLGSQFPDSLEEHPERIGLFRKLGVRIMQLTYNRRTKFGDGCLEPANGGLTEQGKDAIWNMNVAGVALDLSHSGYRTASESITRSSKPVLITHSGCAAIYAHPRNTPDEILKLLADHGGYFGVYLTPYLVASPTVPTREHVLTHIMHAIDVCGADHVGIGSDAAIQKINLTPEMEAYFKRNFEARKQAGIAAPGEDRYPYVPDLNGPDHMEIICDELAKRGVEARVIEKVMGANFQRVIGEIWGTR